MGITFDDAGAGDDDDDDDDDGVCVCRRFVFSCSSSSSMASSSFVAPRSRYGWGIIYRHRFGAFARPRGVGDRGVVRSARRVR
jgi:hypothetical protein